jgi:hypothetical protein
MTSHPSQRPISALRTRMIEDMIVRGFNETRRFLSGFAPKRLRIRGRAHHHYSRLGRGAAPQYGVTLVHAVSPPICARWLPAYRGL